MTVMVDKAAALAGAAAVMVLLILVVVVGGGQVASDADVPTGGCAVSVDHNSSRTSSAARRAAPVANQKDAVLDANQMAAARTIAAVGKAMHIAERGIAIALGTAMQESTLNAAAISGRAVGLFQQQGALYRYVNRRDPAAAARAFFDQLVRRIPDYTDPAAGTFADLAQAVQQSGAGAARYAGWETWASELAHILLNGSAARQGEQAVECADGAGPGPIPVPRHGRAVTLPRRAGLTGTITFPNTQTAIAAAAALSFLGTPYAWGGGGPAGPTKGVRDGGAADEHGDYAKTGFDCSGLTEYAWAQAGTAIGGDSRTQRTTAGPVHPYLEAQPGDLVFYGTGDTDNIHHVALYLGAPPNTFGAYMVEAPQSGDTVKVSPVRLGGDFRNEVVRPWET